MAWTMQRSRRHDHHVAPAEGGARWDRPPTVEAGQIASVHAPRASDLVTRATDGQVDATAAARSQPLDVAS